jgi:hypothetical protein
MPDNQYQELFDVPAPTKEWIAELPFRNQQLRMSLLESLNNSELIP